MTLGELKPLLTTLVLPPAGPLLLALLGLGLAWRRRRAGLWLALAGVLLLWLLSCQAVAVWLGRHALPQVDALAPAPAAQLREAQVQAIVVLGGGLLPQAREYGEPQPSAFTAARLRYGMHLSRSSGLPMAFAGGVGWGAAGREQPTTEAQAAARFVQEAGLSLRWLEERSRDTAENAQRLAELLQPQGIRRIALVTDAWHQPRSILHFERAGFVVLPAPMAYLERRQSPWLDWLPSAEGLADSRRVLREWLGLRLS